VKTPLCKLPVVEKSRGDTLVDGPNPVVRAQQLLGFESPEPEEILEYTVTDPASLDFVPPPHWRPKFGRRVSVQSVERRAKRRKRYSMRPAMPRQAGSTRSITFMPSSRLGPPEKRALWIVGQRSSALRSGPNLTGGRPLPAWSPASRYYKFRSGWLVGPSDLTRLYRCICRSAFLSSSPVIGRGSSVSLRSSCRRLIVSAWRLANRRGTSCSSWGPSRQQPCQAILLSACPWQRTVPRTVVKDITFLSAQRQSRTSVPLDFLQLCICSNLFRVYNVRSRLHGFASTARTFP